MEPETDNSRVISRRISLSSHTSRKTIILEHDTGLNTISVPITIGSPNSSVASNTSTRTPERIRSPVQHVHGNLTNHPSPSATQRQMSITDTKQTNVSYFDQSTDRASSTAPALVSSSGKLIPTVLEKSATDNNSPTTKTTITAEAAAVNETILDSLPFEGETGLNSQPSIDENRSDNLLDKEEPMLDNVPIKEKIRQPPENQEDVEMDIIDDGELSMKSLAINDTDVPEEEDTIMEEQEVSAIREKPVTVEKETSSVVRHEEHATVKGAKERSSEVENDKEAESREGSPIEDNREKLPVAEEDRERSHTTEQEVMTSKKQKFPLETNDGFTAMGDIDMYDINDNNFDYDQDEEQAEEQAEETVDEYGITESELTARLNEMDFLYKPTPKYIKMKRVAELHIQALRDSFYEPMRNAK